MEFIQTREWAKTSAIRAKIAGWLVFFARLSLGAMIIVLPMHYRWNIQVRDIPPVYNDYTSFYLYLSDIPLFAMLGSWLLSLALHPRRLTLRPNLLTGALGGLWIVAAFSIFSSSDRWLSFYTVLRMLLSFGLYMFLINEKISLAALLVPLGLQIGLQASVALGQVIFQGSAGLVNLQELKLDPYAPGISMVWVDGLRWLRAYGLTDHPNILGGSLALALLLLLAGYLAYRKAGWVGKPGRIWFTTTFALGSLALLFTFSRSAWLALAAGLILVAVSFTIQKKWEDLRHMAVVLEWVIALMLPAAWIAGPFINARLDLDGSFQAATPENQSIQERSLLLAQAGKIVLRYPFTGIGAGAYPLAFHQQVPDYPFAYQPPHLVAAEVAAETGLPGLIFYLAALLAPWGLLFASWKSRPFSLALAGITAALLAITLISFLDYYPWLLNAGREWQWLIWGLWGAWFQRR